MEASPPGLCLSRGCEGLTLPCPEQQQASPAPRGRLSPPRAQGSQDTPPRVQSPPETPLGIPGENPSPGRTQQSRPRPPAASVLLGPHPCACSSLGAPGAGAQREANNPTTTTTTITPALCNSHAAVPRPPAWPEWRSGVPLPGRRHVAALHARPPPPPPGAALTAAPRLLRPAGDSQGGRRPGPRRARGSAERAYGPQVAGHPEHARSERAAAPGCAPGTRLARVAGTQPGRSCGACRPIGPHPGEGGSTAGPGAFPTPLGLFQSPGRPSPEPALSGSLGASPKRPEPAAGASPGSPAAFALG